MLARIAEERDVDTVVVHKVVRLAGNLEDPVAIQGALRNCGVRLVCHRDGRIAEVEYHESFDLLFAAPEFEYVRQVGLMALYTNLYPLVTGSRLSLSEPYAALRR